ncbi:MAG TPA: SagB family peptide dehydrogenase [Vicinamibacterales bacterium]|nr:SagB family peptide dehydrogenase [Vicinamibacterales bacterium]
MRIALQLKPSANGAVGVDVAALPAAVRRVLALLAEGRHTEEELNARVIEEGDVDSLLRWQHVLALCTDDNLIAFRVEDAGRHLVTVEPLEPGVSWPPLNEAAAIPRRLSRFAYLRRDNERIVLESPHARARLILAAETIASVFGSISAPLAAVLDAWNFLEPAGHEPPAASTWEFHDALFHRASRLGGGRTVGATYRLADRLRPWPAYRSTGSGRRVALRRPDLGRLAVEEATFTAVAEARRSIRSASSTLTLEELSSVLFRTLHVRAIEDGQRGETIRRAVPSGGALHELEAYVAVRRCTGLVSGVYWYDAHSHQLEALSDDEALAAEFADQASRSWGRRFPPPDVFITLAARFPRVAWKYEAAAYRIVLLNAGVVMQMLYLVATAMGLAPCAVANGDPALLTRVTGADPFEETSVGEFALSGRI